jgi:hypothetical protein
MGRPAWDTSTTFLQTNNGLELKGSFGRCLLTVCKIPTVPQGPPCMLPGPLCHLHFSSAILYSVEYFQIVSSVWFYPNYKAGWAMHGDRDENPDLFFSSTVLLPNYKNKLLPQISLGTICPLPAASDVLCCDLKQLSTRCASFQW